MKKADANKMVELVSVSPDTMARELDFPSEQVKATFDLLEKGYTVSFIARYRKDQTQNLNEQDVAKIAAVYHKQRQLSDRKYSFLKTLDAQGKLTPELEETIRSARTARCVDDAYLPFRSKRASAAQAARDKGLDPLADAIFNAVDESKSLEELAQEYVSAEKGVGTVQEALAGAGDILAERFSENTRLRRFVRDALQQAGLFVFKKVEGEDDEEPSAPSAEETCKEPSASGSQPSEPSAEQSAESPESAAAVEDAASDEAAKPSEPGAAEQASSDKHAAKQPTKKKQRSFMSIRRARVQKELANYFGVERPIHSLTHAEILDINRGENLKVLTVEPKLSLAGLTRRVADEFAFETRAFGKWLAERAEEGIKNLAIPSLVAEKRREQTDAAEEWSVSVVARNVRNLLLQRPIEGRRVLGVEPNTRYGSRIVALDEKGAVLAYEAVFMTGLDQRREFARTKIIEMVEKYNISVIAIGNGPGSREAADFISRIVEEKFADKDVAYIVVNDVGASAYAASPAAEEEFPSVDQRTRAAASIGRRLQNPLDEFLKFDVERFGQTMFQHDVHFRTFRDAISNAISLSVNQVGVDLNAAPPAVLRYVSGLNPLMAKRICDHRDEHGPFKSREQLKEVSGLGETAYQLCAGFMKVSDGDNPLDATWIHPESYELATNILSALGFTPADILDKSKSEEIKSKVEAANAEELARQFDAGVFTVADILGQFVRPGADPRFEGDGPIFKKGVLKLEDLKPGMKLRGTVLNAAPFGLFVDVGAREPGLVHVSCLGPGYVRDPFSEYAVGDVLTVWVLETNCEKGRLSLTMIDPSAARESRRGRGDSDGGSRGRRPRRDRGEEHDREERRERRRGEEDGDRGPRRERRGRDVRDREQDRRPRQKQQPVELKPLTEEMKSGKEPLRSFSDLAQFFNQ